MLHAAPGQPGKFKVGKVTDSSIELTWEPAYTKEGIVNYELLYKPVRLSSLVRTAGFLCSHCWWYTRPAYSFSVPSFI